MNLHWLRDKEVQKHSNIHWERPHGNVLHAPVGGRRGRQLHRVRNLLGRHQNRRRRHGRDRQLRFLLSCGGYCSVHCVHGHFRRRRRVRRPIITRRQVRRLF